MKFSINLFDDVHFTIHFNRDAGGVLVFEKVFVGFLGRPKHPHLSLFNKPSVLKPHFTAARRATDEFRWWLPAVRVAEAKRAVEHTASAMMRRFSRVLEPADLSALQEGGWFVHWADFRALSRWLKIVMGRSRELRFDNEVVETIASHILRKRALPTAALGVPADTFARAVALRWDITGSVEVRPLVHFPDGVIGWGWRTVLGASSRLVHARERLVHVRLVEARCACPSDPDGEGRCCRGAGPHLLVALPPPQAGEGPQPPAMGDVARRLLLGRAVQPGTRGGIR